MHFPDGPPKIGIFENNVFKGGEGTNAYESDKKPASKLRMSARGSGEVARNGSVGSRGNARGSIGSS